MWHDHDIDFARWLHPGMWNVALESWQWIRQVATPCNVIRLSGMTCHWIRLNVRHIEILHLVSISTTSAQSTSPSAPVSEILSKSDHPWQKKMTSCWFSRWRISAILDFTDPIYGFFEKPTHDFLYVVTRHHSSKLLNFWENRVYFAFWRQTDRQTNRWTDGQHRCTKTLSLSRAAA